MIEYWQFPVVGLSKTYLQTSTWRIYRTPGTCLWFQLVQAVKQNLVALVAPTQQTSVAYSSGVSDAQGQGAIDSVSGEGLLSSQTVLSHYILTCQKAQTRTFGLFYK